MITKVEVPNCHDCNCAEGELHTPGCDMETCPFCGQQLITCGCCYELLKIDCSPGTYVYEHGLSESQYAQWDKLLNEKVLIPYVECPNLCSLCGVLWPDMFHDDDWEKYVIPALQSKMLCKLCFNRMKKLFPKGWANL